MSVKKSSNTENIKKRIQDSIDNAKEEQKKSLFRKRVDLAKRGLHALGQGKIKEAIIDFKTYLKALEDGFNVNEGGLNPSLFDREKEVPELLLIAGIYWDLAKIYDRSSTEKTIGELKLYLNMYVTFSKGMPYEAVSAETLRKYIRNGKATHKDLFRETYRKLSDSKCFVATTLVEWNSLEDLKSLRKTRDEIILNTYFGQKFVFLYEKIGPIIATSTDYIPHQLRYRIYQTILWINAKLSQF